MSKIFLNCVNTKHFKKASYCSDRTFFYSSRRSKIKIVLIKNSGTLVLYILYIQRYAIIIEQCLGSDDLDSFNNATMNEDNILDKIYICVANMSGFLLR